MLVFTEGWHCLPFSCCEPRMGHGAEGTCMGKGRLGAQCASRLLKNDVNPVLQFPFVMCSRSGPALEVPELWISHVADGNAAAGPWKGFIFQPTQTGKNKVLFS